jgi:hypothetical protein
MIKTDTPKGTPFTLITVLNYQRFQTPVKSNGHSPGHTDLENRAHRTRISESETPNVGESPTHCRLPDPPEPERSPEVGADAPLSADKPPTVPVVPAGRYPSPGDLPKQGGDLVYPMPFEALWAAYPRRREDGKLGCYKKFRTIMRDLRPDPRQLVESARRWREVQGQNDYRPGLRGWLDEGKFKNEPPPPRSSAPMSNHNRPSRHTALRRHLDAFFETGAATIEGEVLEQ